MPFTSLYLRAHFAHWHWGNQFFIYSSYWQGQRKTPSHWTMKPRSPSVDCLGYLMLGVWWRQLWAAPPPCAEWCLWLAMPSDDRHQEFPFQELFHMLAELWAHREEVLKRGGFLGGIWLCYPLRSLGVCSAGRECHGQWKEDWLQSSEMWIIVSVLLLTLCVTLDKWCLPLWALASSSVLETLNPNYF